MIQSKKIIIDEASPYKRGEVVFESSTPGEYDWHPLKGGVFEVFCVGAGGTCANVGRYDDRGYIGTGGSSGLFIGEFYLSGQKKIQVGNIDGLQSDSKIEDVLTVKGGGNGSAWIGGAVAGTAGEDPVLLQTPINIEQNKGGNPGKSGVGGKGSHPEFYLDGGSSIYEGYGAGGYGTASEYDWARSTKPPTSGYVKIVYKRRR